MERPRFSVLDLFWTVTLIGVGLGCFLLPPRLNNLPREVYLGAALFGFGALVAGVCAPYQQKSFGFVVAVIVALLFGILVIQ